MGLPHSDISLNTIFTLYLGPLWQSDTDSYFSLRDKKKFPHPEKNFWLEPCKPYSENSSVWQQDLVWQIQESWTWYIQLNVQDQSQDVVSMGTVMYIGVVTLTQLLDWNKSDVISLALNMYSKTKKISDLSIRASTYRHSRSWTKAVLSLNLGINYPIWIQNCFEGLQHFQSMHTHNQAIFS